MTYHVARNSQQIGTYPKEELINLYNAGMIFPTDLVWTEGMANWEAASKVFGAPAASSAPPPLSPPMAAAPIQSAPPKPNNNLVGAILVTLFCCWPLGIPSIVFAAQVDGKYNKGDYAGAEESARKSRVFMWWSLGLGLVGIFAAFGFGFMGALMEHRGY